MLTVAHEHGMQFPQHAAPEHFLVHVQHYETRRKSIEHFFQGS
jgi:hypothetical protein